jgi:hypothetical protein
MFSQPSIVVLERSDVLQGALESKKLCKGTYTKGITRGVGEKTSLVATP